MKTFKIKDLMVSLESEKAELANAQFCHFGCTTTPIFCHFGCSIHVTPICWGCTIRGCTVHYTPGGCAPCTFHVTYICPIHTEYCIYGTQPGTIPCGGSIIPDPYRKLEEGELDQMKAGMEELQKEMDAQMAPQSLEDLDKLDKKLNEALAEIKVQRSKLQEGKEKGK